MYNVYVYVRIYVLYMYKIISTINLLFTRINITQYKRLRNNNYIIFFISEGIKTTHCIHSIILNAIL